MSEIILIDNQDSFVYNLVDSLAATGHDYRVYRNTIDVDTVLAADPALLVLSPGPGHPAEAGHLMDLVSAAAGKIPMLGLCLGFQALLEHFGGKVVPCGPEHGRSLPMRLSDAGVAHPVFAGLAVDAGPDLPGQVGRLVPVARYHSLGCLHPPAELTVLATAETALGEVVMAAESTDGMALGLQYHPESILTPAGPIMLERCIDQLLGKSIKGDSH